MSKGWFCCLLILSFFAPGCSNNPSDSQPQAGVALKNGDLLVIDTLLRALFVVNPETGDRTLVSSRIGGVPRQIARDADGTLFLTLHEPSFPVILRVAPTTGELFIVSSGGSRTDPNVPVIGSGPPFSGPLGLVREASGTLLVSNRDVSAIYRVDAITGDRTVLSGPSRGDGPAFFGPTKQLALETDGTLLVVVGSATPGGSGAIFRVNPTTGNRTVLTGPDTGQGPNLHTPEGITLDGAGVPFVSDIGQAAIVRIDPLSGDRTIISSPFTGRGETPDAPAGLTFNIREQLLVADRTLIYRVDLSTGDRTVISAPQIGTGTPLVSIEDIFTIKD